MECVPVKKRRIQFSLGTLLMCVITLGACMGFYFSYRENTKLRAENEKLRDVVGVLDITDPEKAWVRTVNWDDVDKWCRRIYVPRAGFYRVGIQTEKIGITGIDRTKVEYYAFHADRGQFAIDFEFLSENDAMLEYFIDEHDKRPLHGILVRINGYDLRKSTMLMWKDSSADIRFNVGEIGDGIYRITGKPSPFPLDKPLILVALKKLILTASTHQSATFDSTLEPGPGLLIWFEEVPK